MLLTRMFPSLALPCYALLRSLVFNFCILVAIIGLFIVVHTFLDTILDEKCVLRILHFLTHRTPSHGFGIAVDPLFIPPWSCCSVEVKNDPAGLQH